MGFGWMFLGYCFLLKGMNFSFGLVDITPDIFGFLLMLKGFNIANESCDSFKYARIAAMVGLPISLGMTTLDIARFLNLFTLPEAVANGIAYGYDIFRLLFTLVLLYALYLISTEVSVDKLRKKAVRCAIYSVILFFFAQSTALVFSWFGVTLQSEYVSALAILADSIGIIINATLIFGCYMRICLEGDEDMPDNREYKYKTPFDYFDRRRERDLAEKQVNSHQHKKKK